MARSRDYAAEYRRRIELGRERGLSSAQAAGHAARAKVESITTLRARGDSRVARPARATGRKPLRDLSTQSGMRLRGTGDQSVVRRIVEDAAAAGDRVTIRGRYMAPDGSWRIATADGTGAQGQYLSTAQQVGGSTGPGRAGRAQGAKVGRVGRRGPRGVEITTGGDKGMDASELLDYFSFYASIWEALIDLWEAQES